MALKLTQLKNLSVLRTTRETVVGFGKICLSYGRGERRAKPRLLTKGLIGPKRIKRLKTS